MRIRLFPLFFLFISCNNSPPKKYYQKNFTESSNKKEVVVPSKKRKKTNYSKLITNQNVKEKLFEFGSKNKEDLILIKTVLGSIKIKLYKETPLHRANFIMLAKRNFFDSTIFYRVIRNFMIQGGNSDDNNMLQKMAKIGM